MASQVTTIDSPTGQSPLRLFGGMLRGRMQRHSSAQILACADDRDVAIEMMRADPIRGRTDGFYADQLDIDRSLFSRMLSGNRRFALTESEWRYLENLTSSLLWTEWTARRRDFDLVQHKETPEEELERLRAVVAQRSTA